MTEYTQSIKNADKAIRKKGRDICIERTEITTNASTPWIVPSETVSRHVTKGVFLDYSIAEIDGSLIQSEDQKVLIPSLNLGLEPSTKDKIVDGEINWSIKSVKPLKPGGESIIYEVQVRR